MPGRGSSPGPRRDAVRALLEEAAALHRAGRLAAALAAYRRVLGRFPDDPDALFLAGSACHRLGQEAEAETLLRAAVGVREGFVEAHNNLGMVLKAAGRLDGAEAEFRRAVSFAPGFAAAHLNLGDVLKATGRLDAAVVAYRRAVAAAADDPEAHNNLAMALRDGDQGAAAERSLRHALALAPDYGAARYNLATLLLEQGKAPAAMAVCRGHPDGIPPSAGLIACRAIAARELGNGGDAAALSVDLERVVRPVRLAPPPGFAGLADFNEALARHLAGHPTLVFEPDYQSTRHGRVTRDLLRGEKGPVGLLEEMTRRAVNDYRIADKPSSWNLSAWGVIMERHGHQTPHIHPAGWLSGVYYVRVPPSVRDDDPDRRGWIEFGRPPDRFPLSAPPAVRLLRPEEGLFVLFPSHIYHRTIPFDDARQRISIAFDATPVRRRTMDSP